MGFWCHKGQKKLWTEENGWFSKPSLNVGIQRAGNSWKIRPLHLWAWHVLIFCISKATRCLSQSGLRSVLMTKNSLLPKHPIAAPQFHGISGRTLPCCTLISAQDSSCWRSLNFITKLQYSFSQERDFVYSIRTLRAQCDHSNKKEIILGFRFHPGLTDSISDAWFSSSYLLRIGKVQRFGSRKREENWFWRWWH